MYKILIIIVIAISLINNTKAHDIKAYDKDVLKVYSEENFAPFNSYTEEEGFQGASIELANRILEKATFKHTSIKNAPWARAYYLTMHQPNTLLFSMYRTPLRENLFSWVGPIGRSQIILLAKKGHEFNEENARAAAIRASASLQTLEKMGFDSERIVKLNETKLGVQLLNLERIDFWAVSLVNAKEEIKKLGLDFNDYYIYKVLAERDLYFAFNKNTPDDIKNFFSEKLEELKKSGEFNKIMMKYGL